MPKIVGQFTSSQLNLMRTEFSTLSRIDPSSPSYNRLIALLDAMNQDQLIQIRDAHIPFMSRLAINRIRS